MTEPKAPQPIADDIPTGKAWKAGRRVYVRCGYASALNAQLRDLGAKWDPEVRALWVGTGKLDKVTPLVREQAERVAAVTTVKAEARWVSIPYDATRIREAAKAAGAVWDADRKQWAMPTDESMTDIATQVQQWTAARDAARAAEQAAQRAAEQEARAALAAAGQAAAADAQKVREAAIIARSGRTALADRVSIQGKLQGRMRRPEAERAKPQPGEVRRLQDGRRVLVLECTVEFANWDDIDNGTGWVGPYEEPGWFYDYEGVVVEPTAAEAAKDAERAAELADEREIEQLVRDVRDAADPSESDIRVPDGQTIEVTAGSVQPFWDGRVTLTGTGEVWYAHPGYYDDYRRVCGSTTDPELISRVRAAIDRGSRTRGRYEVRA